MHNNTTKRCHRTVPLPGMPASPPSSTSVRRYAGCRPALALLIGSLFSLPAAAELSDTIHPFVATSYSHEDNLLRLSDNDMALFGGGDDNLRSVAAGFTFERPVGRQLFTGNAKVSRVSFDKFGQLDYTGKDAAAEWKWMVGDHLSGHLGASYDQTLTPFADFHSDERNLRVIRHDYADGNWLFHPRWQVHAGYVEDKYTYALTDQRFNNRTEQSTSAGIDYLSPTSSTFGVVFRRLEGHYPFQEVFGSTVIDNGYVQNEEKVNIYWAATPTTDVLLLAGLVQRKHNYFTDRDDNGTNGRLIVNWRPRVRLHFSGQLWREFTPTEGALINSALNKGESLNGGWELSAKLTAEANLKNERRDFSPFAAIGVALPSSSLSDTTRSETVGLTYHPVPQAALTLNGFHEARSGSVAAGTNSYRANGVSFSASMQF